MAASGVSRFSPMKLTVDLGRDGTWCCGLGGMGELPGGFLLDRPYTGIVPEQRALWVFSKESVRDGRMGCILNSAWVLCGVTVQPPCWMGRLRLGAGRSGCSVGGTAGVSVSRALPRRHALHTRCMMEEGTVFTHRGTGGSVLLLWGLMVWGRGSSHFPAWGIGGGEARI